MMFGCIKQNTAVKTAIDACSFLAKQTFFDLVGEPASSLTLTLNKLQNLSQFSIFILLFPYQWLITLFTRVLLRVTVYYYYVAHASEAVVRSCSVKKAFLEISQNLQENACARVSFLKRRLWKRCFPVNFAKYLRTSFLTEHLWWLLLAFQSESTLHESIVLELLARNRRNI